MRKPSSPVLVLHWHCAICSVSRFNSQLHPKFFFIINQQIDCTMFRNVINKAVMPKMRYFRSNLNIFVSRRCSIPANSKLFPNLITQDIKSNVEAIKMKAIDRFVGLKFSMKISHINCSKGDSSACLPLAESVESQTARYVSSISPGSKIFNHLNERMHSIF